MSQKSIFWTCLTLAGLAVVSLVAFHQFLAWTARQTGEEARLEFGGDRVEALMELVDCTHCGLRDRSDAVWALGVIGDRRALPVLEKHHTGEKCQHGVTLCQYELDKAIKKIEGTWGLRAAFGGQGTDTTE